MARAVRDARVLDRMDIELNGYVDAGAGKMEWASAFHRRLMTEPRKVLGAGDWDIPPAER